MTTKITPHVYKKKQSLVAARLIYADSDLICVSTGNPPYTCTHTKTHVVVPDSGWICRWGSAGRWNIWGLGLLGPSPFRNSLGTDSDPHPPGTATTGADTQAQHVKHWKTWTHTRHAHTLAYNRFVELKLVQELTLAFILSNCLHSGMAVHMWGWCVLRFGLTGEEKTKTKTYSHQYQSPHLNNCTFYG